MTKKHSYGSIKQDIATKACKLTLTIKRSVEQAEFAPALTVEQVVKNLEEL